MRWLILVLSMLACSCTPDCKSDEEQCRVNAAKKARAELQCMNIKTQKIGWNVLVTGCGKTVTYECFASTPEKEGSRAERLSGD